MVARSRSTARDQVNAWDDFYRVEHGALLVLVGGAKFLATLLFV